MNTPKSSLFQAILARLSFGTVPVDGAYWFDPRHTGPAEAPKRPEVPHVDWSPISISLSRHLRRP